MVVNDSHSSEPTTKRRRCEIGEERTKEEQPPKTTPSSSKVTTVFIGGLHPKIVEAHLEKMCQPYGTVERLHLCERKGYAFCQFANSQQAQAAMQALDGRGLLGRRLMVRPAHDQNNNGTASSSSQRDATSSGGGNPQKERERIEARIQAVKRKLQDAQEGK